MKKFYTLFFLAFILFSQKPSAQQTFCGDRYDKEVFSNYISNMDITFGSAKNFYGSTTTLKMDIYQPSGDTLAQRPLIIWVHGGSFIGGDKLNGSDVVDLARKFAKRGYITASINYRLYYLPLNSEVQAKKAVMRAVQDLKAAIRFFRKDAYTTNTYKIDTNNIYIAGSSAGAFTAMHNAYLDTDAEFAAEIDTTGLGGLEGNSGNPGYSSKAHAVVNLCGALGNSNYLVPGDEPLLSMHGTIDGTVPYATAPIPQVPSLLVHGSYSINDYADSIGLKNSMYTWFGADHTPYVAGGTTADQVAYMDTTVRFISNFLYEILQCSPSDPNPFANTFPSDVLGSREAKIDFNTGFSVSPNPAQNKLFIDFVLNKDENVSAEIFDILGKTVSTVNSKNYSAGKHRTEIDCEKLNPGIYFIKLKHPGSSGTKKIVIGK